jgi:hypothetical protein
MKECFEIGHEWHTLTFNFWIHKRTELHFCTLQHLSCHEDCWSSVLVNSVVAWPLLEENRALFITSSEHFHITEILHVSQTVLQSDH